MSAATGIALGFAVAVAIGMVVGFSVQSTQINPVRPLVQQGNFTWDIWTQNAVVADSLVVNYWLYQYPGYYLLKLDALPRPLAVPGGVSTNQNWVQVRMHLFDPPVGSLNSFGWWELIIPLSQSNLANIVVDAPCYFSTPPTCNIAGWPNDGLLGDNSIGFASEGNFPNYEGYAQIYMQTIAGGSVDWTNATFWTLRPLELTLMSA
jgi:hypothetical protein